MKRGLARTARYQRPDREELCSACVVPDVANQLE
jgi:hypothetical protein